MNLVKAHRVLLLLASVLLFSKCESDQVSETAPNIILIVADDLGYSDLSYYRARYGTPSEDSPTSNTPFIDGIAKEGIHFTDFYSGAAVCSPSRAALLTGRNKTRLGIYNWIPANVPMHLEREEVTIAEMLKQQDYETGHFGKWHLTSGNMPQPEPLDQGFDYAFWTHNNAQPSHENPVNFIRNRDEVGELIGYSSHLVVDETIDWLTSKRKKDRPFYINLWFHEPHVVEAAPDSLKMRHTKNQAYYGSIENMDYAVGRLLKYLKDQQLEEKTLIIFTSDNGSEKIGSNGSFRGEKCYQFEGGIRVPFIVSWKGKIQADIQSNTVGHFTDVLPTIAALINTDTPQDRIIDGADLSAILLGQSKTIKRKEPLFFYRYFHDPICMLRADDMVLLGYQNVPKPWQTDYDQVDDALFKPKDGGEKWSQWSFQKSHMEAIQLQIPMYFELYNMTKDLSEQHNIAEQNPELLKALKIKMLAMKEEMVAEGGAWFDEL